MTMSIKKAKHTHAYWTRRHNFYHVMQTSRLCTPQIPFVFTQANRKPSSPRVRSKLAQRVQHPPPFSLPRRLPLGTCPQLCQDWMNIKCFLYGSIYVGEASLSLPYNISQTPPMGISKTASVPSSHISAHLTSRLPNSTYGPPIAPLPEE
jgi:hypothetical protein